MGRTSKTERHSEGKAQVHRAPRTRLEDVIHRKLRFLNPRRNRSEKAQATKTLAPTKQKPDTQPRHGRAATGRTDTCGRPSWGPGMRAHGTHLRICPPLVPRTPSRTNSAEAKAGCQALWPLCWEAPDSRPRGTAKCTHPTCNPAGAHALHRAAFSSFSSDSFKISKRADQNTSKRT